MDTPSGAVTKLPPWIMGHRGAKDVRPENSLEGFEWAIQNGVRSVEFDVRLTADGHLVCVHDETLKAYGGPDTPVAGMTAEQVTAVPLDAGVRVPLLTDVLDLAAGRLDLNIEIKNGAGERTYDPSQQAARVVAGLLDQRAAGGAADQVVAVSSFDHDAVSVFAETSQRHADHGALLMAPGQGTDEIAAMAADRGMSAVHPHHTSLLRSRSTRHLTEQGLTVRTWTVNSAFFARRLVAAGVVAVVTDNPLGLL
ncbi:glycerophosphodiester phosphodiesterase [Euzebya tangerina]|uniref:glycerophosphodiester phosphodiesterase n=1 Tax=Euzebya tangerina TaxID=591198 RepID=UPI0013C300FB|nr:glycerophosphodiester phosphodiesterase [Euzebya tangerina]